MNNYGNNNARKRNAVNIQLTLSNLNLKGERFKFELEWDSKYRKSLLDKSQKEVKEVIVELSKQELYQKPHLMASYWAGNPFFILSRQTFQIKMIYALYIRRLNVISRKWFLASLRHRKMKQRVNAYNILKNILDH